MHRRDTLKYVAAAAAAGGVLPGLVRAQATYPSQPIKFVVPFTAGSVSDIVTRAVTERMEKSLKTPCIVENRPGAGGTIGAAFVANAAADGYTVLVHSVGHVANASLYPKLKYDTLGDFTPITMLVAMPTVLVTAPDKGYSSLKDLVQKANASPGQVVYASAGNGSGSHIASEKFRLAAGMASAHIPYRGAPEALNDVMAGRVDWFMAPMAVAGPLIASGRLKALAVTTPKRVPQLPEVPTTLESGFEGSADLFWIGMFVQSATPREVVARLHAEALKALQTEEVQLRIAKLGAETAGMPQQEFAALVKTEAAAMELLISKSGMRVD